MKLSGGAANLLESLKQQIMAGSVTMVLAVLLGAFGLFWLGMAIHWALLPALGFVWAWLIPAVLYLALAGGVVWIATRSGGADRKSSAEEEAPQTLSYPLIAEQLGMELGKGLEREVSKHPLRAVSLAAMGGAVLGASPELRRSLRDLVGGSGNGNESPRQ